MYSEEDLLPISALQHLLFCERQCALIHIERLWAENRLTVEGRALHEKAHSTQRETRAGVRIARSPALRSLRLGLFGVADVVELREGPTGDRRDPPQAGLTVYPVEYKRGRPKRHDADRVQLCAQALCLEEMLGIPVVDGALFYGRTRHREQVTFDAHLRQLTESAANRLHAVVERGMTPLAAYSRQRCDRCSLLNLCLPRVTGSRRSATKYLRSAISRDGSSAASRRPSPIEGDG